MAEPMIVQFPHPGAEHVPEGPIMGWHRGEHARKFLVADGSYVEADAALDARLAFWGEWEPQSEVQASLVARHPNDPHWLHQPFWCRPRHRRLLKNTDPLVFGDRFMYSNCRQLRNAKLRALAPGSMILFGSKLDGEFVLDTVFVVEGRGLLYSRGFAPAIELPDWLRAVVFEPLAAENRPMTESFRLYRGRTRTDAPDGPFSFVPSMRWEGESSGFARPPIRLDPRYLSPKLALGAKATPASPSEVRRVWDEVVQQVRDAGLLLGVRFEAPAERITEGVEPPRDGFR